MTLALEQVLVTGATGFIGNALARGLAERGYAVRAIVRKTRLESAAVRALSESGVTVVPGDVCNKASVAEAASGCSHVYHLAAQKTTRGTSFAQYFDVNVKATRQLAECALKAGVTRFVYASTLGVHGFVAGGILDESSPVRPNTDYRRTKWLGEEVVRELHRERALPAVIARISTVVGSDAKSWNPLIRAIKRGSIKLIGNGVNHIDLVSVDDIVNGLWQCGNVPGIEGQTYVLGSASRITLRAFADEIAHAAGAPSPRNGPPLAPYQATLRLLAFLYRTTGLHFNGAHNREALVANKIASSARARAELGYAPSHPLSDAIRSMVARFAATENLQPGHR